MSESDDFPASPKRRSIRRQPQTQQPDPLRCPRCESTNTKFCYFNNYNKTQPRYFCKSCKRHWTKGGTLRNVPIGGGRKNKRLRQTTITATATVKNNRSIDQDSLLPSLSDPNETFDVSKDSSFMETIDSKRSDDVESYTDIEELKGLVSWDFCESFTGCRMQDLGYEDLSSLGFSKMSSFFETNPSSSCSRSFTEEPQNGEDLSIATNKIMLSSQEKSSLLELNNLKWINDLDIMVFEDLNKPWEDPTFKT